MNNIFNISMISGLQVSIKIPHIIKQRLYGSYFNGLFFYIDNTKIDIKTKGSDEAHLVKLSKETVRSVAKSLPYNIRLQVLSSFFTKNFISNPLYLSRKYLHSGSKHQDKSLFHKRAKKMMSLRAWENNLEDTGVKPGFIFTIMSYNILAQDLLEQHPYLYQYHDAFALNWSIRWNNIFNEIRALSPDILCLQEVQESHLKDISFLNALGYESVFKKRTGSQTDGCAIYYKTNNISLIDKSVVEYFQPTLNLLNRDNVGIVIKFAPKLHPTREFVVATTHLLYNPRRDDVRMAQMQLLLADIEKMSYKNNGKNTYYLPVIITGDLNSSPYSYLYQFITHGNINYADLPPKLVETHQVTKDKMLLTSSLGITDNCQHEKVIQERLNCDEASKMANLDNCKEEANNYKKENVLDSKQLTHNFYFKSVYNHGLKGMIEATTFQDEWLTVDYIFYSKSRDIHYPNEKLKLLSRYRLPTSNELNGITIPNRFVGSDHLSLVAKFKLEF